MPGITKVGDTAIGTCPCHKSPVPYTATIASGAATVMVNGVPAGTVGGTAISSCGHPVTLISGSPTVMADGLPVHRVGDSGTNGGPSTTVSGSPDVNAG